MRNVALVEGIDIAAVAEPDDTMRQAAQITAAELGQQPQFYQDWRALLAGPACDALIVATPNDTHYHILQEVIARAIPVLCEKPLATTPAHCSAILHAAARQKAVIWVGMGYRYMAPVTALKNALRDGVAGRVRMVSIREHRLPFLAKVGDWNRFAARTGGTLVEKCCHFWDLMRYLLDCDPVRLFASAAADVNHRDESYNGARPDMIDNAYVIVDFANGARAMLDLCMFAEGSRWQETVTVIGDRARLEARVPRPVRFSGPDDETVAAELAIATRQAQSEKIQRFELDPAVLRAGDHYGATYYQHCEFRDLLLSRRRQVEIDVQDGAWAVIIGAAAERSARTGEIVTFDPVAAMAEPERADRTEGAA